MGGSGWRVWVDTGGTFTDCLAVDPEGRLRRAKVLSSGVLRGTLAGPVGDGVASLERGWGLPDGLLVGARLALAGDAGDGVRILGSTEGPPRLELDGELAGAGAGDQVEVRTGLEAPVVAAHVVTGTPLQEALPAMALRLGTTRATNALLERRGARTALVVTAGFADLLEIGTQQRPELFALEIVKPPPLAEVSVEAAERLAADGAVLKPLDEPALARAAAGLASQGIESVAVALLHAFREPRHEQRARVVLEGAGLRQVSLSSEVAPVLGLLERAETTVVDAYLGPVLEGYLAGVRRAAAAGSVHLMTSAGGLASATSFRAVDALLSGPAGGVVGAVHAARRSGCRAVLALDMGGTSTDVSRWAGDSEYVFSHRVGDAVLAAPALAIETVAAGGGSVCHVEAGRLRVGPASAGADPGPACYGAGGPLTITDANLMLGRILPERFGIPVDVEAARAALGRLREDLAAAGAAAPERDEELLEGLLAIADERMAGAMRRVSVRRGYHPGDHVLVAFGGAGPQHATAVAGLLGIREVLVPVDASLLSAAGMGHAVVERFAQRQVLQPLDEVRSRLADLVAELADAAATALAAEGIDREDLELRRRLVFLRLAGQDAALEVPWTKEADLAVLFADAYRDLYGYPPPARAIEVESVKVIASSREAPVAVAPVPVGREVIGHGRRRVWLAGGWREAPVLERERLAPGDSLGGPALVVEAHSTTVVPPGWRLTVDGARALRVTRTEKAAS